MASQILMLPGEDAHTFAACTRILPAHPIATQECRVSRPEDVRSPPEPAPVHCVIAPCARIVTQVPQMDEPERKLPPVQNVTAPVTLTLWRKQPQMWLREIFP